ncbi:hypothetical protein Tco_0895377 [Tanacetum coccineum]|uniref:Uncharacterized protein n=1 Tax=Tanacetum coccineum TaxID=301880 RepID=A0ABQ5CEG1_9ASTR
MCDPNHLIGECSKPPKNNDQREFIGGAWSDNGEDEVEKTKDETCLVAQAPDEICLGINLESDEMNIKIVVATKHLWIDHGREFDNEVQFVPILVSVGCQKPGHLAARLGCAETKVATWDDLAFKLIILGWNVKHRILQNVDPWKRISEKRTKNEAKNDKTGHGREEREKDKVKKSSQSQP